MAAASAANTSEVGSLFKELIAASPACDARDQRFLMGGNFFGTEAVAPPPRDASDLPEPPPDPKALEKAAAEAAAAAGNAAAAPKLMVSLKVPPTGRSRR